MIIFQNKLRFRIYKQKIDEVRMNNFTLRDFSQLLEMEQNMLDNMSTKLEQPGTSAVNKIIAYSKAVSVKKLSKVEPFVFLLN